jgi:glyoxylase I family protein
VAIKEIFHINVNCTDLERSRAFYELVGFRPVVELGEGGSADMLRGLGLASGGRAKAVLLMLNPDNPRGTRIDLIQWTQPATHGTTADDLAHVGAVRIALWTVGIDDEVARLRDGGIEFLSDVVAMPDGTKFCCFKDPDGTVLELIDFSSASRSSSPRL